MGRKRMSSELTIMTIWPTLSDEGKRIIGDWIASQVKVVNVGKSPRSRKPQSRLNPLPQQTAGKIEGDDA